MPAKFIHIIFFKIKFHRIVRQNNIAGPDKSFPCSHRLQRDSAIQRDIRTKIIHNIHSESFCQG
jgi:hypothetical protein